MSQPTPALAVLGARIRELRGETQSTQRALGKALGVGTSSVSGYESGTLQPPGARLRDIATYVIAMRRPGAVPGTPVPPDSDLTEFEIAARGELLRGLEALRPQDPAAPAPETPPDLWTFPAGEPVLLVAGQLENMTHPYSGVRDANYTSLLTFADLDALVELHGHIRARNPDSDVRFVRADRLSAADDLASNLVMLGGPGLNERLQQILNDTPLPMTQEEHPDVKDGEVFYVSGQDEPELPDFAGRGTLRLSADVALLARLNNPYSPGRTLTWCSGIYSRGVLGSVRILTDAQFRDQNGAYLADRFAPGAQFAILARVPVVFGEAITPDLQNEEQRLYEWSDAEEPEQPGEARPAGGTREASS